MKLRQAANRYSSQKRAESNRESDSLRQGRGARQMVIATSSCSSELNVSFTRRRRGGITLMARKISGTSSSTALPRTQMAVSHPPSFEFPRTGRTTVMQMTARSSTSVMPIKCWVENLSCCQRHRSFVSAMLTVSSSSKTNWKDQNLLDAS